MTEAAMNTPQRILSILCEAIENHGPMRLDTLVRQANKSSSMVAQSLTKMKKIGLVAETNGFWCPTEEGKEVYTKNKYWDTRILENGNSSSRENWAELLDVDYVRNSLACKTYAESAANLPERTHYLRLFAPFVIAFLAAQNKLPNIQFVNEPEESPLDAVISKTVKRYDDLIDEGVISKEQI